MKALAVEARKLKVDAIIGVESRGFLFGISLADELNVPLLGQIPLVMPLREGGDTGRPITAVDPDSEVAKSFHAIARKIAEEVKPRRIVRADLKLV